MTSLHRMPAPCRWFTRLASALDKRSAPRLARLFLGAGRQQVRFLRANVGAFHVCLWGFTMTEAWAWSRPATEVVDRSASPWDTPSRRPSHADERRARRRELLGEEIRGVLSPGVTDEEIQATADRLLGLAA